MRIEVVHGRHDFNNDQPCAVCHGKGSVLDTQLSLHQVARDGTAPFVPDAKVCPECKGTGLYRWRNAFTYDCPWPVRVGDIVLCPGNAAHPREQEATVIKLGSSYLDPVSRVLGVVERREQS